MNIKHTKGPVEFRMRAGKDLVKGKIFLESAQKIVDNATCVTESDGQIIVDDLYLFPAQSTKKPKPKAVIK